MVATNGGRARAVPHTNPGAVRAAASAGPAGRHTRGAPATRTRAPGRGPGSDRRAAPTPTSAMCTEATVMGPPFPFSPPVSQAVGPGTTMRTEAPEASTHGTTELAGPRLRQLVGHLRHPP